MKNSVLGCLIGAAAGDAMGAATEIRTREEIRRDFGGYVGEFREPPRDTFAGGNRAGQITDDFSLAYYACEEIVLNNGRVSGEIAKRALLRWFDNDDYNRFCGPTTRAGILRLKGEPEGKEVVEDQFIHNNGRATNGAGMKASPMALFSGGDVDKAIRDAVTLCCITHDNNISLSGAGAVAAATAMAMHEDSDVLKIFDAGLYGAREGDRLGRSYQVLAGPSIEKRIRLAGDIALGYNDVPSAIEELGDVVGAGLYAVESIPTVFGIIVASRGNPVEGILGGVNIGDDTDTVATMVGGILGAYAGSDAFPPDYLEILERENDIDLRGLSEKIMELI